MTTTNTRGHLGNRIIINLSVSLIAEKNDLFVNYCSYDEIKELGIELFIGKNIYYDSIELNDNNYFNIYKQENIIYNLNSDNNYFQTKEITTFLYNYLNSDKIKNNIIDKNPFNNRYNNNNDLFIHIRLGNVERYNPRLEYYLKVINMILYNDLYISTDTKEHYIIKELINKYPQIKIIEYEPVKTIQFASTCKYLILSHGSFSAIIGYLSFYSDIYYSEFQQNKIWHGDIFSIDKWNKIIS